jgi:hypothetical protein
LEYIYFMKIGQPKLSERVKEAGYYFSTSIVMAVQMPSRVGLTNFFRITT